MSKYLSNYTYNTPSSAEKGKNAHKYFYHVLQAIPFPLLTRYWIGKKMCRPRVAIFLIRSNQSGKCVSCQAQLCGPPFIFYKSSPRFFPQRWGYRKLRSVPKSNKKLQKWIQSLSPCSPNTGIDHQLTGTYFVASDRECFSSTRCTILYIFL